MQSSEQVMERSSVSDIRNYFETHDISYVAEDAVFTTMNTGEKTQGREGIQQLLNYFYHIAFDARAVIKNIFVSGKFAVLEATFTGKHIGEFAGVAATNREVTVPLCVTYKINDEGRIQEANIYMLMDVLMQQIS